MSSGARVDSPCIKVCTLDGSGELCLGCFRTLEEIGDWAAMSDAQRLEVLDRLPGRRLRLEAATSRFAPPGIAGRCERCGAAFACGAADPERPCWCASYPPVRPEGPGASCLCPACLSAASATR